MLLLPAIDLRGGKCVRLKQGDYAQETVFGNDPVAMAQQWESQGAQALHLVDLDGAKAGQPTNGESIRRIAETLTIPCQLGGGLRSEAHIELALSWGVRRVILGTRALKDQVWFAQVARAYPGQIILGLDAKDGRIATDGWLEVSSTSVLEFAQRCADWPLAGIVYTDISKDGMLAGPNLEGLAELARAVPIPIIASGGVTTVDDVRRLAQAGLAGCIIGRALYEGRILLADALAAVALAQSDPTTPRKEVT